MAFHQWLNSTSKPQPTPAHVVDATDSMSKLSPPPPARHNYALTNGAPKVVVPDVFDPSLDESGDLQATNRISEAQMDGGAYNTFPGSVHSSPEKLRHHPTMRLSHLEHVEQAAGRNLHTQRRSGDDSRRKYHELMQQSTGMHWQAQMNKAFVPGNGESRDRPAGGRPSLAATHPANYGPPARRPDHSSLLITTSSTSYALGDPKTMPPRTLPTLDTFEEFLEQMQTTSPLSSTSSPNSILSTSSPPEVPWRVYSDPMHQTSFTPDFPEPRCTILRSDRRLEPGNVISPTFMIALPCGGMVEMAYHYPSKETLETTLKGNTGMDGL